jgi:monoterpene epsilon-lactone hydrolase
MGLLCFGARRTVLAQFVLTLDNGAGELEDMMVELNRRIAVALTLATFIWVGDAGAQTTAAGPQPDSSVIDSEGTAHITRVIPVPTTVSREAQKVLARQESDAARPTTLSERRAGTDKWQAGAGEESRKLYPVKEVAGDTIAGVPVRIITPLTITENKRDRVLINVHGGGFNSDSGSLTETIPIANLTGTKVVAILYRLAPEHPFPAAVDDTVAVYKELLKTYKPRKIALYGTSAGAILTAEVAVKLKQLGLPLPGALGIFSGMGDLSQMGDSWSMYALNGLSGHLDPPVKGAHDPDYIGGSTDAKDPVLSPVYADLTGMPPALLITSGRDILLSGTTILHRAYLHAGVDARLVVFEALPHAFWNNPQLPESKEADGIMAKFFDEQLGR